MIAMGPNRLRDALATLTRAADAPVTAMMAEAHRALSALVAKDDWLPEAAAIPHPDYYQQYLLFCDPLARFSIVSFVWGPGQQTPIHDHGTWGLIGMLRGAEISRSFALTDGALIAGDEDRLDPGDVATLLPEAGDIHQVRNAHDDAVSISIHIYGGDIGAIERRVFRPNGTIAPFVSGYSNDALPNVWGQR